MRDDRDVDSLGDELSGKKIDFVVTGGIGGIESPKVIRELRRYGAEVRVWMTSSAQEFVNPRVFEWASKNSVITELSGSAEHISSGDAAVVVPCTLDFMAKLSLGLADSPALTCLQSLAGRKPIFLHPSMHQSLQESPSFQSHRENLRSFPKLHFLPAQQAEGKFKISSAGDIVARVAHELNKAENPLSKSLKLLLLMGPTRSYLDDLRYLGNYSSGRLGLQLADKLYRRGYEPMVISGALSLPIPEYLRVESIDEAQAFHERAIEVCKIQKVDVAICAAALLDFEFERKRSGKISSEAGLSVELKPRPKLIEELRPVVKKLVGFKLESQLAAGDLEQRVQSWNKTKKCELVFGNRREDISPETYRAYAWNERNQEGRWLSSRSELVSEVLDLVEDRN